MNELLLLFCFVLFLFYFASESLIVECTRTSNAQKFSAKNKTKTFRSFKPTLFTWSYILKIKANQADIKLNNGSCCLSFWSMNIYQGVWHRDFIFPLTLLFCLDLTFFKHLHLISMQKVVLLSQRHKPRLLLAILYEVIANVYNFFTHMDIVCNVVIVDLKLWLIQNTKCLQISEQNFASRVENGSKPNKKSSLLVTVNSNHQC